jgi:hypothetical protein
VTEPLGHEFLVHAEEVRWVVLPLEGTQPFVLRRAEAAAAAQAPEEVGVLLGAGPNERAVRGDHVGREEVVGGEFVPAHQPAEPAAEGEARDARVADDPAGRGEPEGLGLMVELPQSSPGCALATRARGSTHIPFIAERSMTIPPSQTAVQATLWPPPRTATTSSRSRANPTAPGHRRRRYSAR